ncbi:helix-turn-helix transcriptional regulator [Cellvibrio sp. OA-2007]|uniref:helix-turn-helix transcriptional regulator n=1 Tax=Cellvibrio sp. OA-2007 TaxID=529823 RepID=UPI0007838549
MSQTTEDVTKRKALAADVVNLRLAVGHTQKEAAAFLYVTTRTYQNWEYSDTMPFAIFELYQLKAMARGLISAQPHTTKK